ncbi:hypothetical protein E3U55_16070 [Filobacillus milosensis]|uniref:Uncharacterized protein n=1 Tax=Filobacillus milosensis TaxID=94137 RepID=A0A4Y8IEN9_9BACI|nr:hypothetical protein [Filobacillus milosensis]TFB13488.1 hypothetical protein E3U55_16070 [Filobacillus milosensis]
MYKKVLYFIFIFFGMVGLLYLMNDTFWYVNLHLNASENPYFVLLKMSLWGFLFGVFIEWRSLKDVLIGNIRINWLIAPAAILIVIGFIPIIKWVQWFGVGTPFYIEMLSLPEINVVINIASGILLVRGLSGN